MGIQWVELDATVCVAESVHASPTPVVNVTVVRARRSVQSASTTAYETASRFRYAPSRLHLLLLRLRLRGDPHPRLHFLLHLRYGQLSIQRGDGHVVVMGAELDQVPRVRQERGVKPLVHDTSLSDDVVPFRWLSPAPGDTAPPGLLRHLGHATSKAAMVFNPLQVTRLYSH